MSEHTDYYRHLAETIIRAEKHPTSPNDKIYKFLDFGLVYGPSEKWPKTLIDGWVAGGIPEPDGKRTWPSESGMEELFNACRKYLRETEI